MTNYRILDSLLKKSTKYIDNKFSDYKAGRFDELNIMSSSKNTKRNKRKTVNRSKTVKKLYDDIFEFLYAMWFTLCDKYYGKKYTYKTAPKWLKSMFTDSNPVTKVTYETELLRKRDRLAEGLEAVDDIHGDPNQPIDKSKKELVRFVGWYGILITDECYRQKMKKDGVERVMWVSEGDDRVCDDCKDLHGKIFDIDAVPTKPHPGCRCKLKPVR